MFSKFIESKKVTAASSRETRHKTLNRFSVTDLLYFVDDDESFDINFLRRFNSYKIQSMIILD